MKPKIGLVGCFQNGKSTLINSLLKSRVAFTGEGNSKTKQVVCFVYGDTPRFTIVENGGKRTDVSQDDMQRAVISTDNDVSYCEIALPVPILKDIDIVDTPGFDADERDTKRTTDYLKNLHYIFYVYGRDLGSLHDAEREVLKIIQDENIPFSFLYNCFDKTDWDPESEKVRKNIRNLESVFESQGVHIYSVRESDRILPVNLAWYWQSLISGGQVNSDYSIFEETDAERRLVRSIRNYFGIREEPFPSWEKMAYMSNIDLVMNYITAIREFIRPLPVPKLNCKWNDDEKTAYVNWSLEGDTNKYSFELQYREQGSGVWNHIETNKTREKIEGLRRNLDYEFQIRSKFQGRFSKLSEITSIRIPQGRVVFQEPETDLPDW